ncbi:hypothetical protein COV18_03575 [Candidatus Woesearchaeota archaeon CG10_big_fil_rev_8_21_14_0_10_37_12]|nr:MAG: hypothetical protein COV18_03575 [Candidatus Woesearchaeota archaeon CG10_big_fil_rev_8_21_14_0_10_37_12]
MMITFKYFVQINQDMRKVVVGVVILFLIVLGVFLYLRGAKLQKVEFNEVNLLNSCFGEFDDLLKLIAALDQDAESCDGIDDQSVKNVCLAYFGAVECEDDVNCNAVVDRRLAACESWLCVSVLNGDCENFSGDDVLLCLAVQQKSFEAINKQELCSKIVNRYVGFESCLENAKTLAEQDMCFNQELV